MLTKITQILLSSLTLTSLFLSATVTFAQRIEGSIPEDDLNTRKGLPWNGRDYPYSQVLEIKDSLVNSTVGRVVIDRHQERAGKLDLFGNPPVPGKLVFVSFWGSKIEGCFADLIIQYAPSDNLDASAIYPIKLDIGVGNKIVVLLPQNVKSNVWQTDYTYETSSNGSRVTRSGTWYMARQLFIVDAGIAEGLSQSPSQNAKARITFANGDTLIFPIGAGTVSRWKEAYGFNPSCTAIQP